VTVADRTAVLDRSARREELLAAADAVVQREGADASMATIAAAAGITKPVLYRHFGDKGGLYAALVLRHTERLAAALRAALEPPGTREQRVRRTVDAYLAAIEAEPQVYRFLVRSTEVLSTEATGQVRSFVTEVARLLAQGLALETGAGPVRTQAWAFGIVGAVQAAGDWWLEERPCPRGQLSDELTALLLGGYADA
jgi:AcrR family transcriptional regulator